MLLLWFQMAWIHYPKHRQKHLYQVTTQIWNRMRLATMDMVRIVHLHTMATHTIVDTILMLMAKAMVDHRIHIIHRIRMAIGTTIIQVCVIHLYSLNFAHIYHWALIQMLDKSQEYWSTNFNIIQLRENWTQCDESMIENNDSMCHRENERNKKKEKTSRILIFFTAQCTFTKSAQI